MTDEMNAQTSVESLDAEPVAAEPVQSKPERTPMKAMVGAAAIAYAVKNEEAVISGEVLTVPLSLIASSDNPRKEPQTLCLMGYDLVNSSTPDKSLLHMALSEDMEVVKTFVNLIETHENDPDIKEEEGKLDKNLFLNVKTIVGLSKSMAHKQIQPVQVRKIGDSGNYALVYGQRRLCSRLYLHAKSRIDVANGVEGVKIIPPVIIATESKDTAKQSYLNAIHENFGRKDFTPLQEGQIYHDMLKQINPATGKKWNLLQIAKAYNQNYMHVRSRAALLAKRNEAKGTGLTDEDRADLASGKKTLTWAVRRSLGETHYSETGEKQKTRRKTLSVSAIQDLFDKTPESNTERRLALAECMGLTLAKATKESIKRAENN